MKNTERLPAKILETLRYMHTGSVEDKSQDDEINTWTPNELFKELMCYHGIGTYDSVIKTTFMAVFGISDDDIKRLFLSRANDERKWCCWILSEVEVLKAIDDNAPKSLGLDESSDNKELFIKDVVEHFKDALSMMGEDWDAELHGCVNDVVEEWQDRGGDEV